MQQHSTGNRDGKSVTDSNSNGVFTDNLFR
jgi:hypothetical protein